MRHLAVAFALSLVTGLPVPSAWAGPEGCQRKIAKAFSKLNKDTLKAMAKCLDRDNVGTLAGPCPDPKTAAKLSIARDEIPALVLPKACDVPDVAALGFTNGCNFGDPSEDSAAEAACRPLPVTTPAELGICLLCWQQADSREFLALLYASHAVDLCDGYPDLSSSLCSAGGCTGNPPSSPDQRDLGATGENDCQQAIGKAAIKYILTRKAILEKCALAGGTRDSCLGDLKIGLKLSNAKDKQSAYIEKKCGNRTPVPNPPVPVGQEITWWSSCERRDCQGYPVSTLEDLHDCTEDRADEIVEAMLCTQFPRNAQQDWPCPES